MFCNCPKWRIFRSIVNGKKGSWKEPIRVIPDEARCLHVVAFLRKFQFSVILEVDLPKWKRFPGPIGEYGFDVDFLSHWFVKRWLPKLGKVEFAARLMFLEYFSC